MNLSMRCLIASLSLGVAVLAACGAEIRVGNTNRGPVWTGREVALGEEFKLEKDEKVMVKEAGMTVELKSVRRTWYVDGKSETVDAEIIVTLDGKEQRQWISFKEDLRIGDYAVKLKGANPFGKTNATLIVRRV